MQHLAQRIDEIAVTGANRNSQTEYNAWSNRVRAFLSSAIDQGAADRFMELGVEGMLEGWKDCRDRQVGYLEGLALNANQQISPPALAPETTGAQPQAQSKLLHPTKKVFVVHGHDNESKESVARFLERLKLVPIILHEKPNSGRTVIEKFEAFSDVGFAVVLLTPDDVGASIADQKKLQPRARQNVILELGYFMGRLSRFRVCALYKAGVEMPSDFQGVLYVELDSAGTWRQKLAQELVEANFSIDLEGLLHA